MTGESKSVSFSGPLYLAISKFIKDNPEYRGVEDFVTEAARGRVEELKLPGDRRRDK